MQIAGSNGLRIGWSGILLALFLTGTSGCFPAAVRQTDAASRPRKTPGKISMMPKPAAMPASNAATKVASRKVAEMPVSTGPTLRLDYGQKDSVGIPITDFMYFVPLISPEPVASGVSAGNSQRAHILSMTRRSKGDAFSAVCEFEITGDGMQQNTIDHSELIHKKERMLKEGGEISHALNRICFQGEGSGSVEVEGSERNGVASVTEVRMRFNEGNRPSPVTIEMADLRMVDGVCKPTNIMVARVNTLTFRRGTLPRRMAVTIGSVKPKDAGNGSWQTFVGSMTGVAANFLIQPIPVETVGHEAMLDFGRALATQKPVFTFPLAHNLKSSASQAKP